MQSASYIVTFYIFATLTLNFSILHIQVPASRPTPVQRSFEFARFIYKVQYKRTAAI